MKKSKREKEKEAAEAKRKMEEEHAAKAYAEFLDAFDADDNAPARRSTKSSTFVRSSRDSGAAYAPSGPPRSEAHSRSMRAFEPSKVCCALIGCGHPYMTAVSFSSSRAKAERQTRHGCLLRRDQKVRPELHNTRVRRLITALCRDQADREARFARNCKFAAWVFLSDADFSAKPTRGLQPLWQVSFSLFLTTGMVHNIFQPMKDRVEAKTEVTQG